MEYELGLCEIATPHQCVGLIIWQIFLVSDIYLIVYLQEHISRRCFCPMIEFVAVHCMYDWLDKSEAEWRLYPSVKYTIIGSDNGS